MALTFDQIRKRTPKSVLRNVKYVRLLKVKTDNHKKGKWKDLPFVAAQTYSTHLVSLSGFKTVNHSRTKYVTVITFLNPKLHVMCSCSCPDFLYRDEVALTAKGAAVIEYSNGEFPVFTNPGMVPRGCKHLIALYERVEHMLRK